MSEPPEVQSWIAGPTGTPGRSGARRRAPNVASGPDADTPPPDRLSTRCHHKLAIPRAIATLW
eukprot:1577109-Alexandrium_andersonii.AAC.1